MRFRHWIIHSIWLDIYLNDKKIMWLNKKWVKTLTNFLLKYDEIENSTLYIYYICIVIYIYWLMSWILLYQMFFS